MKAASEYQPSVASHSSDTSTSSLPVDPSGVTDSRTLAFAAIEAAIGQKGHDVRGLCLTGLTDIADYFVIVSGTSNRHVTGIADKIRSALRELNEMPMNSSGFEAGEWIVLDYGDLIVHVFLEPTRQYYLFDELWGTASQLELSPELADGVRKLRTGMISS